jgi:hypothetical protein
MTRTTCATGARTFDAYRRGTLGEAESWAYEVHAAECAECSGRVGGLGAVVAPIARPNAAVRASTLARVAGAARNGTTGRRRAGVLGTVVALALAASLAVILARPFASHESWNSRVERAIATRDSLDASRLVYTALSPEESAAVARNGLLFASASIAARQAAPEFAALDSAAVELDAALRISPDDAELRRFRAAIRARQEELRLRVKEARS